ncbi:MAG: DMT family transporter [Eubacteriales bacterium]|nr:DMT family transporter [Eubacteriales bacterium]
MESKRNNLNLGLWLVVLSAVCWSLNSPLVKVLELNAFTLTGMRALIAGLALLPFLRVKRMNWNRFTFLMMLSYMVHCTLIVLALKTTSAPIAVAMQFTAPVWIYIWEHKKGEKLLFSCIWPLFVMLLGMAFFMFSKGTGVTMKGNLIAEVSSLSFAALTYFTKRAQTDNPLGLTSVSNLLTAAVMLLFFADAPVAAVTALHPLQLLVLLLLGVVQTGGGYAFYFVGLKHVEASTAAMLSPLEMVLGPLWVALFLHEYPDSIALAAFVFVIAGVLGEVYVAKKLQKKAAQAE